MPTCNNKDDRHAFTLYGKRETRYLVSVDHTVPPPLHRTCVRPLLVLSTQCPTTFGLYSEPRKCRGNNSVTRSKGWAAWASPSPLP
ncbi:putative Xenotropic and polytropic retrovirus receptor 1 like protein [Fusarium oxysporum f. sp. albedinis]|nr:putative Xenotropic and polytropic retrovirus receptor 1 like protein [Fusarium oxysporum f. sp. albedinis]